MAGNQPNVPRPSNSFYGYLTQIEHPPTQQLLKLLIDLAQSLDTRVKKLEP